MPTRRTSLIGPSTNYMPTLLAGATKNLPIQLWNTACSGWAPNTVVLAEAMKNLPIQLWNSLQRLGPNSNCMPTLLAGARKNLPNSALENNLQRLGPNSNCTATLVRWGEEKSAHPTTNCMPTLLAGARKNLPNSALAQLAADRLPAEKTVPDTPPHLVGLSLEDVTVFHRLNNLANGQSSSQR